MEVSKKRIPPALYHAGTGGVSRVLAKESVMTATTTSRRGRPRAAFVLQKPNGQLTARVQAVGPEHFGVCCLDCAKARSRYFLADFYGKVLLPPTTLVHTSGALQAAVDGIRAAVRQHELRDLVVAIERTGEYHRPVQRAFRAAGFETRLVHPFTSKQYRQPADPGNKTDDTDLAAIFRATTHGLGLCEPAWGEPYPALQVLRRHRRDLVTKAAKLQGQIREILHATMPGYAECFSRFWESPVALPLARQLTSALAVRQAGLEGLRQLLGHGTRRWRTETLHTVLAWAEQAPPGLAPRDEHRLMLCSLDDDRRAKTQQITALERSLAHLVVRTPYALLLAIPGVNIVTVADLAGELGPMPLYANANAITGRAGLMPSRYQSDQVDRANGPLRRRGNRRLRGVLMQTADNLVQCNHYFRAWVAQGQRAGKDPRWLRVKVAKRFSRLAYAIVAGRQLFPHPCCQPRHYILGKLLEFHAAHDTPLAELRHDLETVIEQLPAKTRGEEQRPLQEQLDELARRRRGPQPLAEIIPLILARLGMSVVESESVRERTSG
jgi:transposase